MYDLIIIGSGPAGLTAAIFAARREMKVLVVGKLLGGQVSLASEIENYPGFRNIQSFELINNIAEQVKGLGAEIKQSEIKEIKIIREGFELFTNKERFKTKTVIIAMGLQPKRLEISGEAEFAGKGVSYCANCDGPFFKKKVVTVIGGGNSALDAAEVMSKIATSVNLIHRRAEFRAFEALVKEVSERKNIKIYKNTEVKEIKGNQKVEKLTLYNKQTGESHEIETDGVFIEIGRIAHTDLVANLVKRDERDQIIINERGETSTKGLFAAGDVTNIDFKQIPIACGQATIAALASYQYLQYAQGKDTGAVLDRSPYKK